MATTITAGGTSSIAMSGLLRIEVYSTSLIVKFIYASSVTTITGSDATDFITNGLPFLAAQAPVSVFPLL